MVANLRISQMAYLAIKLKVYQVIVTMVDCLETAATMMGMLEVA